MRIHLLSVLAIAGAFCACRRDSDATRAAASSASAATSSSAPAPSSSGAGAGDCLTQLDFLLPFQSYEHNDLVRAITVDGDQVFFRTMKDVLRMPLAGGTPVVVSSVAGATFEADARPSIWIVGDRLVGQSPGEPVFVASPKAGGPWTPIVDLSRDKLGGKQTPTQHLVHDLFKGSGVHAHPAVFDGASFYWIEATTKGPDAWSIRAVALSGGPARTLYESHDRLHSLEKAGDRLVFTEQEASPDADKAPKAKKPSLGSASAGPTTLMSLPVAGGKPERLGRIGGLLGSLGPDEVLLTDGDTVYVSGYEDEDVTKPGIFRTSAAGGAPLKLLDARTVGGRGLVYGDRLVFAGHGRLEAGLKPGNPFTDAGIVVLTGPRTGTGLERAACIQGSYTTHAYAVAGKILLVSIFRNSDRTAGILRVPLP